MLHSTNSQADVLVFRSLADISKFKHECVCNDFYVDRDLLTMVGKFSKEQIQMAVSKYNALVSPQTLSD
jgi:hypothetical protein